MKNKFEENVSKQTNINSLKTKRPFVYINATVNQRKALPDNMRQASTGWPASSPSL